jgi:hypothetical protein
MATKACLVTCDDGSSPGCRTATPKRPGTANGAALRACPAALVGEHGAVVAGVGGRRHVGTDLHRSACGGRRRGRPRPGRRRRVHDRARSPARRRSPPERAPPGEPHDHALGRSRGGPAGDAPAPTSHGPFAGSQADRPPPHDARCGPDQQGVLLASHPNSPQQSGHSCSGAADPVDGRGPSTVRSTSSATRSSGASTSSGAAPELRNPHRGQPGEGSSPLTCHHTRLTNTVDTPGPQGAHLRKRPRPRPRGRQESFSTICAMECRVPLGTAHQDPDQTRANSVSQ